MKLRDKFRGFVKAYSPSQNFIFAKHISALIQKCQESTEALERGECVYKVICLPFRHGKSTIVSKRFPVWHLLRNPDHEVMLGCYNHNLALDMSCEARDIFKQVAPKFGYNLRYDRASLEAWRIEGHRGAFYATGIGGTVTGRGADLMILDDPIKGREAAESKLIRDKIWDSFQSDLMTRLAPKHAVLIVGTRWHEDDLVGRIIDANDKESENFNPDFPKFEVVKFPAWDEDKEEWLFPERFSKKWYTSMKAMLSAYAWNAEGQQDPRPREGNLLKANQINEIPHDDFPEGLKFVRGWDVASSEKERTGSDPDYTVGTLSAFKNGRLYVKDVARIRAEAPKRDKFIQSIAKKDGRSVLVRVEVVAGYKDTYTNLRSILSGHSVVHKFNPGSKDKIVRASYLEALFESGSVYVPRGEAWVNNWKNEMLAFPSGKHDDQVDSLVVSSSKEVQAASFCPIG